MLDWFYNIGQAEVDKTRFYFSNIINSDFDITKYFLI